jgi:hypothetical protein
MIRQAETIFSQKKQLLKDNRALASRDRKAEVEGTRNFSPD